MKTAGKWEEIIKQLAMFFCIPNIIFYSKMINSDTKNVNYQHNGCVVPCIIKE